MVLSVMKELKSILSFAKRSFTKGGFRHVTAYVDGLISLTRKTIKAISEACVDNLHQSALNRILNTARFEKELLEERYLKKLRYFFKNLKVFLLFDDTLVERNGPHVEEAQKYFDHSTQQYIQGHQFFTAVLYTPGLQLPLFPELYSKNTGSKIEMAQQLITKLIRAKIRIHTVLFDSWYSDKDIIKTCLKAGMRVICAIKTNRKVRIHNKRDYRSLAFISERAKFKKLQTCVIGNKTYECWSEQAYLFKLPLMRLVISHDKKRDAWKDGIIHLISTQKEDTCEDILCTYKIRWRIETYHRDIKQNLGFAKTFVRKKEGIVRHAILVALAYATLSLLMFRKNMQRTIGQCCEYVQHTSLHGLINELMQINDKELRIQRCEEVFKSKIQKL